MPKGVKAEDKRLQTLEEQVASLASSMAAVVEGVKGLGKEVSQVKQETHKIPLVQSAEASVGTVRRQLTKAGQEAMQSRVRDLLNPGAAEGGFPQGAVVRLRTESELARVYKIRPDGTPCAKGEDGEPALGVIERFLYWSRKNNSRKYRVKFPGFKADGVLERDLELCST